MYKKNSILSFVKNILLELVVNKNESRVHYGCIVTLNLYVEPNYMLYSMLIILSSFQWYINL